MTIGKKYLTLMALVAIAVPMTGCIRIFKSEIRQGNHVEQAMLDELRVGMDKEEVQQIMGTPALVPIINTNRWDYHYRYTPSTVNKKEKFVEKSLSLYFVQGKLKYYSGDWHPKNLRQKPN